MKARYIKQVSTEELEKLNFDLILASSGYEARADFVSRLLSKKADQKIVFAFNDHKNHSIRKKNDSTFHELKYRFIDTDGDNSELIIKEINHFIEKNNKTELSILIDYSSMTRVWYASIIDYFKHYVIEKTIQVYFSYSCAGHKLSSSGEEEKKEEFIISHFSPISEFCGLSVPFVPTALITGLGYETNQTYGLKEFFDAELAYLFYTENNEYTNYIIEKNKDLLKRTDSKYIIPYSVNDVLLTKTILYDLCNTLKNNFRIIIAPCGPKIFTLISFFVASELGSIDIWRISSSDHDAQIEREATGEIITCEICYE